jgi:hypothetical protein
VFKIINKDVKNKWENPPFGRGLGTHLTMSRIKQEYKLVFLVCVSDKDRLITKVEGTEVDERQTKPLKLYRKQD